MALPLSAAAAAAAGLQIGDTTTKQALARREAAYQQHAELEVLLDDLETPPASESDLDSFLDDLELP